MYRSSGPSDSMLILKTHCEIVESVLSRLKVARMGDVEEISGEEEV